MRLRRVGWRVPAIGLAVLAVLVGYVVAQLSYFPLQRGPAYDEAVYLAQVRTGAQPVDFNAQRARGLPWLVSPVADRPIDQIRLYLVLVYAGLALIALAAWARTLRWRAAVGGLLFCSVWLSLWYGSELFPNQPSAWLSLAAAGFLATHLDRSRRSGPADPEPAQPAAPGGLPRRVLRGLLRVDLQLVAAAAAVAAVTVLRPTEGTMLAAGLSVGCLTLRWRPLLARAAALGTGLLVGWLPWVVEAHQRFGGPARRLGVAAESMHSGWSPDVVRRHLSLVDGPLTSPYSFTVPGPEDPTVAAYWCWAVLGVGALVAVGRAVLRRGRGPLLAVLTAAALAVQYLHTPVVEARFLLPSYALLCMAVAAALPPLPWDRRVRLPFRLVAAVGWVGVLAAVLPFMAWQRTVVHTVAAGQYAQREVTVQLAAALRARTGPGRCFFAAQYAFPEISLLSGCTGAGFLTDAPVVRFHTAPGDLPVYVITPTDPARTAIGAVPGTVQRLGYPQLKTRFWFYRVPPSAIVVEP